MEYIQHISAFIWRINDLWNSCARYFCCYYSTCMHFNIKNLKFVVLTTCHVMLWVSWTWQKTKNSKSKFFWMIKLVWFMITLKNGKNQVEARFILKNKAVVKTFRLNLPAETANGSTTFPWFCLPTGSTIELLIKVVHWRMSWYYDMYIHVALVLEVTCMCL